MTYANDSQRIETALKYCAAEPVHTPGAIQAHGALIAVDNQSQQICYASDNMQNFLRVPPDRLLGRTLTDIFGRKSRHELCNGIMLRETGLKSADLGRVDFGGLYFDVTSAAAGPYTLLEFESATDEKISDRKTLKTLEVLAAEARAADSRQDLFEATVHMLYVLTGFDRVMIYEFEDQGNGMIRAERVVPGLPPYLGLHFPAWDIPDQARALMKKVPLRCICDVGGRVSQVLAAGPQLPELDLTYSILRATSPVHVEYLRNMGSLGSMTLNIVIEERLWGIISLQHQQPRLLSQRMRQLCRCFCEFFTLKLTSFEQADRMKRLKRADSLRRKSTHERTTEDPAKSFETELLGDLCKVIEADGAAFLCRRVITQTGQVPDEATVKALFEHDGFEQDITATDNLAQSFPNLKSLEHAGLAGILVARLPGDCSFIFFRKATDRCVTWAGAPEKKIILKGGVARLTPRASFEAYQQQVKGRSAPWTPDQLRIAEDLQSILRVGENADLILVDNRRQSLLILELNLRVRDILARIRSLTQQTLVQHGVIHNRVDAFEAQMSAGDAAHDPDASTSAPPSTLRHIVQQEAAHYSQNERRVVVSGEDREIRADFAPALAQVIHELMANAVEYGALSTDEGQVLVRSDADAEGLHLTWQEVSGPSIVAPEDKGIATAPVQTSVPFQRDGKLQIELRPEGLKVAISFPPHAILDTPPLEPSGQIRRTVPATCDGVAQTRIASQSCLLVGGSYSVLRNTARVLESFGFRSVALALRVEDALEKLDRLGPGVAILEISLSGGETSKPVAKALAKRGIPFIFLAGDSDILRLGGRFAEAPVLSKPFQTGELRRKLCELLP